MLRRFCVFADANGVPRDHGVLHSWFHWVGDLALVWPLVSAADKKSSEDPHHSSCLESTAN